MKTTNIIFLSLALFCGIARADYPTVDSLPGDGADSEGYYWIACKNLEVQVNLGATLRNGSFRADFLRSPVTPNSKGTNLASRSCSWVDRPVSGSESSYLFNTFTNGGLRYTLSSGSEVARDIVFANDLPALTRGVIVVRGKTISGRINIKLETLKYVR